MLTAYTVLNSLRKMPLLTPSTGEPKPVFISRCMTDPQMKVEFPDLDQRAAVCVEQFEHEEIKNKLYRAWQG